jgi:hypothetical protein
MKRREFIALLGGGRARSSPTSCAGGSPVNLVLYVRKAGHAATAQVGRS